ncbi:hypothetical protein [Necropsobacter rosorum]|uniref:hypothetical protein n=1 Tax=Necropsobacter rosorum TaxID=908285 RepID=UPI000509C654
MLPKTLLMFTLIMAIQFTWADPFDKTRRTPHADDSARHTVQAPAPENHCHAGQPVLADDTAFAELNIIGVIIYSQHGEVLLTAQNHALFSARRGDFIGREKLKIDHIEPHQIRFLRWQQEADCRHPTTVTLKL